MIKLLKLLMVLPMMVGIYFYRYAISPLIPCHCRFVPTCSAYGLEALRTHGLRGMWFMARRLCRCHPWGGDGLDPVPPPPHLDGNAMRHFLPRHNLDAMNNTTPLQSSQQGTK
jgi:putative membrane protein insertion efficiency factor